MDEKLFLRQLRQNEPQAWKEFCDLYYEPIYRFCSRYVKDHDEARSLVHDSFFKAQSRIDQYKEKHSLKTWIYAIAHNTVRDYLRKFYNHMKLLNPTESLSFNQIINSIPDNRKGPRTAQSEKDSYARLFEYLNELNEIHHEVVLMKHIDGLSVKEMAKVLGVPEETIKSRLRHAKKNLLKIIPKDFYY